MATLVDEYGGTVGAMDSEAVAVLTAGAGQLSGPMVGIVGTVIRRGNTERFVASVRFLGRGAAVELADWQVERVDE